MPKIIGDIHTDIIKDFIERSSSTIMGKVKGYSD